jgi:hypothetical protein
LNIVDISSNLSNTMQAVLDANIFHISGSIYTEAFLTLINQNWFLNNNNIDDQAFITVKNGTLLSKSFFGVPVTFKGKKRKNRITGEEKIWDLGGNLRWIDNINGKLYLFDTRWGGESGGRCAIFNQARGGSIYIDGGAGGIPRNPYTKKCYFYFKNAPEWAEITGVSGVAGQTDSIILCEPGIDVDVKTCGVMMLRTSSQN